MFILIALCFVMCRYVLNIQQISQRNRLSQKQMLVWYWFGWNGICNYIVMFRYVIINQMTNWNVHLWTSNRMATKHNEYQYLLVLIVVWSLLPLFVLVLQQMLAMQKQILQWLMCMCLYVFVRVIKDFSHT